jgi:DNA-binding transcriptional ArsR family regulator
MRPIQVFAALADPTRLDLFERLAATGPATATELARTVSVSRQAVAKHLTILDEVGLVERAPAGREVRYHARPDHLDSVVGWVASVGDEWDSRLDRLRRAVDAT